MKSKFHWHINMNPPITSNFKKHKHIVKSKSMVFFLDIYIYYLILWLFFWRLFVSIIHGSQPLDQRNHSPSAASTSTAQWARPRARALRYLRCTRCLSQKKTDITFLVAFFIFFLMNRESSKYSCFCFWFELYYKTIGNTQTFLLFGFPEQIWLKDLAAFKTNLPAGLCNVRVEEELPKLGRPEAPVI